MGKGTWVLFQRWRLAHSCFSKLREKTEGGKKEERERENETLLLFLSIIFHELREEGGDY